MTSYVIQLSNKRLWKNLGADQAAVFASRENAEKTLAGFSGRGALAEPTIREVGHATDAGVEAVDGYWLRKRGSAVNAAPHLTASRPC